MSLIPFIIDLADELHELGRCIANGIDIDDFGFGIYAASGTGGGGGVGGSSMGNEHVQSSLHHQQNVRRNRPMPFYWLPSKRHHPYCRNKPTCCNKLTTDDITSGGPLEKDSSNASLGVGNGIGLSTFNNSVNTSPNASTPGKSAAYSIVNRNGFQVSMNVKQFAANELSVKTINNCIIVEGRHDDKEDGHGVISRHFVRKYMLPKGYDPNDVTSTLSSDGILTVRAPPPPIVTKNSERNERIVEIQPFSGPAQGISSVIAAKEKENLKETAKNLTTVNSLLNESVERKLKQGRIQQQQEQQQQKNPADDKIENASNELLKERVQHQLKIPQQQNERIEKKTISNQKLQLQQQHQQTIIEENIGKVNVTAISSNIEKLHENGETKDTGILMSIESAADDEPILDSSRTVLLTPAKIIKTEIKNIATNGCNTNNTPEILNDSIMQDNNDDDEQQQHQQQQYQQELKRNASIHNVNASDIVIQDDNRNIATTIAGTSLKTSVGNNNCTFHASGTQTLIKQTLKSLPTLQTNDKNIIVSSDAVLTKIAKQNTNLLIQAMMIDGVEDANANLNVYTGNNANADGDIEMDTTIAVTVPSANPTEIVEDDGATNTMTISNNNITDNIVSDITNDNTNNIINETATIDDKACDDLFIKTHLGNNITKTTLCLGNKEITN